MAQTNVANTFTANQLFTSGFPQTDISCTGIAATDSMAIRAAILQAKSNQSAHIIVLDGIASAYCAWDGTIVGNAFDGGNTSPIIIGLNANIHTFNAGIILGVNDLTDRVHIIGLRSSASGSFSRSNSVVISGDNGAYPVLDIPGIEGDFQSFGVTYVSNNAMTPTVRVHTFDKFSPGCTFPPCGSTQLVFQNSDVINTGGAIPFQFDDNGLVNRGAWSSLTTYAFDDEVSYMGNNYISAVSGNLNNVPTGGSPNWTQHITIAGFDVSLQGMTINSVSSMSPPLYVQDFGNFHIEGPTETWMITNGGPAVSLTCSTGATCGDYTFHLMASESATGDIFNVTGALGTIEMDNIYPSDGSAYLIKSNTANVVGVKSNQNGPILGILDPASSAVQVVNGSDMDSTMAESLTQTYILPAGTEGSQLIGHQVNAIRDGSSFQVGYVNRSNYTTFPIRSGTGAVTTGQRDYLGGTTASRITCSSAPCVVGLDLENITASAGDLVMAVIPIRTDAAGGTGVGLGVSVNAGWHTPITTVGYTASAPWPAGPLTNDLKWQFIVLVSRVATTPGGAQTIDANINISDTTSPILLANATLIYIPNSSGTIPDSEAIEYAMSLTPYPPSCLAGQSCTPNGVFITPQITTSNLNSTIYVDGVTYPLTALGIQAALTAGGSGSRVILPSGTTTISVESGCLTMSTNQWLSGAGKYATTLKRANSGTANNSIFCAANGDTFTDFAIDGNRSNETGGADNINGGALSDVTVQRMLLENSYTHGIDLSTSGSDIMISDNDFINNGLRAGCVGVNLCDDVEIQKPTSVKVVHNYSSGSQNFAGFSNAANVGNLDVGDNTVVGGLGFVVALGAGSTGASGANIHDNIVSTSASANQNVFDVANWSNVTVRSNSVLSMGTCCSDVSDLPPTQRVTVTNNTFFGSPNVTTNNCVTLGGSNLIIEGNFCQGAGGAGIEITLANTAPQKNIIISGNLVKNNGQAAAYHGGIETYLTAGGTAALADVLIQGNRVFDDQGSPTQSYGVALAPAIAGQKTGYSNFTITGNDLRGNLTAPISNSTSGATGMLIADNGDTATSPTYSAGFNTGSVTATNGTKTFIVTVGTGGATSTGTITMPSATDYGLTEWICFANNKTRADLIQQTGFGSTTVTFTNYALTIGTPVNWTNGDVIAITCAAH